MDLISSRPDGVKLALCVPSAGMWHADFGMSFAQMCVYLASKMFVEGEERSCVVLDKRTSLLSRSRQEMLEDALHQGCTHALFLDSDQTFPSDTAHRLIAHGKGIVACNIPVKTSPSFPTARLRGPTNFGIPLDSYGNHKVGLQKVWRVGTGVMMIDLAVMKGIKKPWFECRYSEKNAQFVGEDWYFCKKLEDAGHDIWIDHDLSRQVGHTGFYTYTHADIPVIEQMEEAA